MPDTPTFVHQGTGGSIVFLMASVHLDASLLLLLSQANKSKLGTALKMISGPPAEEERDWFEGLEGWSQVFRLRYGSKQQQENMVQSKPGTRSKGEGWRGWSTGVKYRIYVIVVWNWSMIVGMELVHESLGPFMRISLLLSLVV